MAEIIEKFTYPGQTVLDPCCRAGTTGIVALRMNRKFIGIDVDEKAIETAADQIEASIREALSMNNGRNERAARTV